MSSSSLPHAGSTLERAVEELRAAFRQRFAMAKTEQALRDEKAKVLGKNGELTALLKQTGSAPPEARKAFGVLVNGLKQEVERAFDECLAALARQDRERELGAPPFDLSLPGREPAPLGHMHP